MCKTDRLLRPIAHRGLHDMAKGVTENTAAAFQRAIEAGVGIECDVRSAADGTPVVFHDEVLSRLVDSDQAVRALSGSEISGLRYRDCGQSIMALPELLALVRNRVPVLVEIKTDQRPMPQRFAFAVASCLNSYKGPVGVMSFDIRAVSLFRQLAPTVTRGIVAHSRQFETNVTAVADTAAVGRLPLEQWRDCEPSFCAYCVDDLPCTQLRYACDTLELALFAWTVRTEEQREKARLWADAAIFEGDIPA